MDIKRLLELVDLAIEMEPVPKVKEYCGVNFSPYYNLLYLIAKEIGSGSIIELGVETGRGMNAIIEGVNDGPTGAWGIYGVDNKKCPELDRLLLPEPRFNFILGSSLPPPEEFNTNVPRLGLLHVDTEHSFAQAREEFNGYKKFLFSGAVVLFDDTNAMDGDVRRFVESLPYDKFFDDRLHPSCGYGGIIFKEDV